MAKSAGGYFRLKRSELMQKVGQRLPWNVFDGRYQVLLKKGTILKDPEELNSVVMLGDLFRDKAEAEYEGELKIEEVTIFEEIDSMVQLMDYIVSAAATSPAELEGRVHRLAERIMVHVKRDPDTAIGIVHLYHEPSYVLIHPIHVALLATLIANARKFDEKRALSLASAALTKNISIVQLQSLLVRQTEPLTNEQKMQLQKYPQRSYEMLQGAGINDSVWLQAVLQHQEKEDGSGNPRGLSGSQICEEARILSLCDSYSAMVSEQLYRKARPSASVLKYMYLGKAQGEEQNKDPLIMHFIKELGIYPPGTFVKLSNEDSGIVVRRSREANRPVVSRLWDLNNKLYTKPTLVDLSSHKTVGISEIVKPKDISNLSFKWIWGKAIL
jgi:HD-GYP domain-containing protein (c-di-GMP phosphodiesterase class II)